MKCAKYALTFYCHFFLLFFLCSSPTRKKKNIFSHFSNENITFRSKKGLTILLLTVCCYFHFYSIFFLLFVNNIHTSARYYCCTLSAQKRESSNTWRKVVFHNNQLLTFIKKYYQHKFILEYLGPFLFCWPTDTQRWILISGISGIQNEIKDDVVRKFLRVFPQLNLFENIKMSWKFLFRKFSFLSFLFAEIFAIAFANKTSAKTQSNLSIIPLYPMEWNSFTLNEKRKSFILWLNTFYTFPFTLYVYV